MTILYDDGRRSRAVRNDDARFLATVDIERDDGCVRKAAAGSGNRRDAHDYVSCKDAGRQRKQKEERTPGHTE
jgi:hypothetical protein